MCVGDLRKSTLEALISAAQSHPCDDTPEMNEIVRRFYPIADRIVNTITSRTDVHDDMVQAAVIAVTVAVRRHDASTHTGFQRYARVYMKGAARRILGAWMKGKELPLEEPDVWAEAQQVRAKESPVAVYIWGFGKVGTAVAALPAAQRRLLDDRYIKDASLETIANLSATTAAAVSQRLSTAHRAVAKALAA